MLLQKSVFLISVSVFAKYTFSKNKRKSKQNNIKNEWM